MRNNSAGVSAASQAIGPRPTKRSRGRWPTAPIRQSSPPRTLSCTHHQQAVAPLRKLIESMRRSPRLRCSIYPWACPHGTGDHREAALAPRRLARSIGREPFETLAREAKLGRVPAIGSCSPRARVRSSLSAGRRSPLSASAPVSSQRREGPVPEATGCCSA
jgi:hypothetical protein